MTALELLSIIEANQQSQMALIKLLGATLKEPTGESVLSCPGCGSPKYTDLSGMGAPDYECQDCGKHYAP